ncbi:MAG: glycosyltransferase family 4 protein [Candidatus Sumerlaeia bacterium]|nr:glycosyltransferase family 4 protein [Candidatus Sumerlaeia bacterium]
MHLAASHRWTGVAEPVTSLALYQQKSGLAEVWLACAPGHSFQRRAQERGVSVLDKFYFSHGYNLFYTWHDIKQLIWFVRTQELDVVHCHLPHDHWLAASVLRFLHTEPVLLVRTVHKYASPRSDLLHRWLFKRATDLIITPTRALAELLKAKLELNTTKLNVVYGAVDIQRFRPNIDRSIIRRRGGIPLSAYVVGIVTRLRRDRGINWLLDSIPVVLQHFPQTYFIIVGRGELKHWLREYIKSSPYRRNIICAGYRTHDLPEFYSAFDCSLFLGLGSDGSSRAVLEAMASGIPVIALNAGGLDEVITSGKNGLLVSPGNREELSAAIIKLLSQPELREQMGKSARQTIEERFTEPRRASDTLSLYIQALNKKSY